MENQPNTNNTNNNTNNDNNIENYLLCPITNQIYRYPVFLDDGNTYELSAISEWLTTHKTSPITREIIKSFDIKQNLLVKQMVDNYLKENKDKEQFPDYDYKKYKKLGVVITVQNNNQTIIPINNQTINNNLIINISNMVDSLGNPNKIAIDYDMALMYYNRIKMLLLDFNDYSTFSRGIDTVPDYFFKCDFITWNTPKIISLIITNYEFHKFNHLIIIKKLNIMILEPDGKNIFHCIAIDNSQCSSQLRFLIDQIKQNPNGNDIITNMMIRRDNLGNIPLHYASKNTTINDMLVNLFLENTVTRGMSIENNEGLTALHYIYKFRSLEFLIIIISTNCYIPDRNFFINMFHYLCKVGTYEKILAFYKFVPKRIFTTLKNVNDDGLVIYDVDCFKLIRTFNANLSWYERNMLSLIFYFHNRD